MATGTIIMPNAVLDGTASIGWDYNWRTDTDTRFGTSVSKIGNLVIVKVQIEAINSNYLKNTWQDFFLLPAGFRPNKRLMVPASCAANVWGNYIQAKINVDTEGHVAGWANSSTRTDLTHVQGTVAFVCA